MINNKKLASIILIINYLFFSQVLAKDTFNFDVPEIQILNNGNLYKGTKRGEITTSENFSIKADNFVYKKNDNTINATGNVILEDKINKYEIFSEYIFYDKNSEEIFSKGETKINVIPKYIIESSNIYLNRNKLELFSKNQASIQSNKNRFYKFKEFKYLINNEILKAKDISIYQFLKKMIKIKRKNYIFQKVYLILKKIIL